MPQEKKTKIVATLGPASSSKEVMRDMILAGVNVFRINFSHADHDDVRERIAIIRSLSDEMDTYVSILADLQGPKLRVGKIQEGAEVFPGDHVDFITTKPFEGNAKQAYMTYQQFPMDVKPGERVLLDDGKLIFEVVSSDKKEKVTAKVIQGGAFKSKKGVNLPNTNVSLPALTEKDIEDAIFAIQEKVDWIALSFVRNSNDLIQLRELIETHSAHKIPIIAKIEKPEALDCLDEIIEISDGIMVARGDLGIEMRLSKVPGAQKQIIKKSRLASRPVITATQMLESMIDNPRPTRAEVSDVANAVIDGSDAVMLSGETAIGNHPIRVVEVMSRVILEAETIFFENTSPHIVASADPTITDAISRSAFYLAHEVHARAIVCLTASGSTARAISRHRPHVPLYAFTDDERVVGQLALSWGTKGFFIPFQSDTDQGIALVHDVLKREGLADSGDTVVITAGMPLPKHGRTNMVHVTTLT